MQSFPSVSYDFLIALAQNNHRDWFNDHRTDYQQAKQAFEEWLGNFMEFLTKQGLVDLSQIGPKDATYRIFRDVRFHKNKPPYNPWFSAMLGPAGRKSRGAAYYLRVEPGKSRLGAGFSSEWDTSMLAALRQEIDYEPGLLVNWLASSAFEDVFGQLQGVSLKRPPKGYPTDHPHIALLKRKEFWVSHGFSHDDLCSTSLFESMLGVFETARPLVDFLNRSLENGSNEQAF